MYGDGLSDAFEISIGQAISLEFLPNPELESSVTYLSYSTVGGQIYDNLVMNWFTPWDWDNSPPLITFEYYSKQVESGAILWGNTVWLSPATYFIDESSGFSVGTSEYPTLNNQDVSGEMKMYLLPVDLDIVHPVTGELDEGKEDVDDGGYVSIKREVDDGSGNLEDVAPVTQLKIHALSGLPNAKFRLKFTDGGVYKIYSDEARTIPVISETTEFPANQDVTLYYQGEKKSASRGGEEITMQVGINGDWFDGDSVKFTVVQSEFQIQAKAFIPYAWTEAEKIPGAILINGSPVSLDVFSPMFAKVAKGDLHSFSIHGPNNRPSPVGFINNYSDNSEEYFKDGSFRQCQTIVLTPYEELHSEADVEAYRFFQTAPESEHYSIHNKPATEAHLEKGYKSLTGSYSETGKPPVDDEKYENVDRTGRKSSMKIIGEAKDGAMRLISGHPIGIADKLVTFATADISWELDISISVDSDPLNPVIEFSGKHDSYPTYEIIALQSDGSWKDVHRQSPAYADKPGPFTLNSSVNVGRSDTITK